MLNFLYGLYYLTICKYINYPKYVQAWDYMQKLIENDK